jgi:cytochrome c
VESAQVFGNRPQPTGPNGRSAGNRTAPRAWSCGAGLGFVQDNELGAGMQRRRRTFEWAWVFAGASVLASAAMPVRAGSDPAAASSGSAADRRGERLFLQCRACHSLGSAQEGKIGPPLGAVVGRKAGAVPGFAYSKALAASGLTWDEPTLDRWLARPAEVVPGTSMVYAGLARLEDRQQLIAYLRRATATP